MSELMKQGVAELEPIREEAITPMGILQMAISQGADIDKMMKLMDMKERWDAMESRKAFVQAMASFKLEPIVIAKDKTNKQYDSRYTSIGELVNTVTPFLAKHGLSAEWTLDQSEGIRVGCTLTHALGHSGETKWMKVPPDASGAKNPIQQIKSSVTYARILTFEMACGLASKEGGMDDDGNGSGKGKSESEGMKQEEFVRYCELIEFAETVESLSQKYLAACKDAKELNDQGAINTFATLKNKRYRELAPAVQK